MREGRGGVAFAGDSALVYRANLWLRTAVRVLRPVLHADVESRVDGWFRVWAEPSDDARKAALAPLVAESIAFRDRYSATDGIDDLSAHIAATHKFMPGIRLERRGPARHCQGTAVADWAVIGADGKQLGTGSNVFVLGPDTRIGSVTGIWG